MSDDTDRKLKLKSFEIDLDSGELRRDGRRVALQEKPFQLLLALIETPGTLVSREVLRQKLWPDVFVDFDGNLNAAVKKLREALGDRATDPRYIETVPRRGYRLIARVGPAAARGRPDGRRLGGRSKTAAAVVVALGAVLAVVAAAGWLRPGPPAETSPRRGASETSSRRGASETSSHGRSGERTMLAVLPFDNLSGDPSQDYLSDGMTEEILTVLGRLRPDRLGVIARITAMTYKGTAKPIAEIGRELEVAYVLEGSVRSSGGRARIAAQLIAVADQTHLWAESYEAELGDLLAVQARIARRIGHSLALELLADDPLAAASLATSVPAAHDHYLRGRHQWNRFNTEGNVLAIAELGRAIELDPAYAQAHAALADAYNLHAFDGDGSPADWFAQARRSAEHALALDPDLAEAHNALAFAVLYGDYDPATADPIFRRARELAPNYAMSYHWHAGALAALGRHDEAIEAVRQALELDPLSLSVKSDLGWYYLFAGRWDDAAGECRATLEMSPGYSWAAACLIEAHIQTGNYQEAVRHALDQLRGGGRDTPQVEGLPARAAMDVILSHHLERELDQGDDDADPLWRAILYARLGQPEPAIDWLERAFARHQPWLVFLGVDPRFSSLRGHVRFEALSNGSLLEFAAPP